MVCASGKSQELDSSAGMSTCVRVMDSVFAAGETGFLRLFPVVCFTKARNAFVVAVSAFRWVS